MRLAIEKSHNLKVDVKTEMGDYLIAMLDQIFKLYYLEYGLRTFENDFLEGNYNYLQSLLGLPFNAEIFV